MGLNRIELRHLRLVQAIAHANGMSAAAKHLHLTQSALSHQLKVLEEALGCDLFLRHGKKLVMTAAGRRVLSSADQILGELNQMGEDLTQMESGKQVTLRIATECITTFQWLPRAIPVFKTRYPDIQVDVLPQATHQVTDLLERGEIDIAIKMVPAKTNFTNHALFSDRLVVVMASSHPLANEPAITPEQLSQENLLLCPNAKEKLFLGLRHHVDTQNIQTTIFPLTEAIMEWCDAGMGVSVIADWAAKAWNKENLVMRPLDVPWGQRKWTAVTLPQELPDYSKHFIEIIKQHHP